MISQKIDEEAIFKIACRIGDADARADYLQQVCGQDVVLKTRLEQLLNVHLQEPDYLEASHPPTANSVYLADIPQVLGSTIGPYTLRERLGEGGMGEVYVAERTDGVRHKVALKIIKPGMATKDVVARFEAERQALAMMDHPNISRVFDGGATEFGQPYFVMELVQGLPVTEYCDAKRLDTHQRLLLFTKICAAVHHAHQKGIIHRDLKPSNILVSEIDGQAVPKVIDFGVAKAINQELTEQTLYTHSSQMVGTPLYMSPEQAGLGVIDIDTRSDIYALGVLLYELIAGSTPFDREQLKSAGFDEMRRIIREDDPIKPSAKVETLKADSQSTVCERRAIDPRTLCRMLKGELDWMVMKAMDKDRNRRYESANELAEDVQRYLRNEVVVAKPATRWYRICKFSQRNRALVASLSAVFLALSVGASLATIASLHADKARDETNQALAEMTHEQENNRELIKLLRKFFPGKWGMKTLERNRTVYESMEEISQTLATDLEDYPEVEVQVRKIFANSYMAAGAYNKAREHLYAALELSDAIHHGQPHETTAEIHAKLADEIGWNNDVSLDFHRLLRHAEKAIAMYEHLGIDPSMALFAKGQCLLAIYPVREAEAEQAQRTNVEIAKRAGERPIIGLGDLGLLLMNLGEDRLEDAQLVLEEAVETCRAHDSESIKLPTTLLWLGRCLQLKGDLAGAIKVHEEAWQLFQTDELRNEGRHSAGYRLVEAYFAQGELGQAFELIDELERQITVESSASLAECLFVKGWLHYQLENYEQAKKHLERATNLTAEHFGNRSTKYIWPSGYLALTLEALGEKDAAAGHFRTLLASTNAYVQVMSPRHDHDIFHWLHVRALIGSTPKDDPRLRDAWNIAEKRILFSQQSWSCKAPAYHKAIAEIQRRLEDDGDQAAINSLNVGLNKAIEPHATFRSVRYMVPTKRCDLEVMLAQLHLENGNIDEASSVLEHAVDLREDALGIDHIQTAMAQLRLGKFLVSHPEHFKIDGAKEYLHAAYKKLESQPAAVNRLRQQAADKLAQIYQAEGDLEQAASWQAKSTAYSGVDSESSVEQQNSEEHGRRT